MQILPMLKESDAKLQNLSLLNAKKQIHCTRKTNFERSRKWISSKGNFAKRYKLRFTIARIFITKERFEYYGKIFKLRQRLPDRNKKLDVKL